MVKPSSEGMSPWKGVEVTGVGVRAGKTGCSGQHLNKMQIAIDSPLVPTAVFAGGVGCNPPGMQRGGPEIAAALNLREGAEAWKGTGPSLRQSAVQPTPPSQGKGPRGDPAQML